MCALILNCFKKSFSNCLIEASSSTTTAVRLKKVVVLLTSSSFTSGFLDNFTGIFKVKVLPISTMLSKVNVPPSSSASFLEMVKPNPNPFKLLSLAFFA